MGLLLEEGNVCVKIVVVFWVVCARVLGFFVDASPKTLPMNPTNPATRMHLTTLYTASIPYRAVVFLKNGFSQ